MERLRFTGMASGLDTESMVRDLMRVQRMPVDKLAKRQMSLEWKRDAYREVNKMLLDFRTEASKMNLQGTYLSKTAVLNRTDIVDITPGGNTPEGLQSVEVKSLATGSFATSTTTLGAGKDASQTLSTQFGTTGTVSFSVNGETFNFDAATESLQDVMDTVNNFKRADGTDLGISLSYDSTSDHFFANTKSTGASAKIEIEEFSGNLFSNSLKLNFNADTDGLANKLTLSGQDAEVVINGATFFQSENKFQVNGTTYQLKSASPGTVISANITQNTDEVIGKIKDFVEKYNKLVEGLEEKLSQPKYRDYLPLLEEEKSEMTENQVKLWEEKAKSGMLKGDNLVSGIANELRSTVYGVVGGLDPMVNHLSEVGITTGNWREKGKLVIDTNKLKEALNTNPDKVMELFTHKDDAVDGNQGIAERLYNKLTEQMDKLSEKAGKSASLVDNSLMGKQIRNMENQKKSMLERLTQVENRYWNQFTALEKAMEKMNQQSSWLAGQLGGM